MKTEDRKVDIFLNRFPLRPLSEGERKPLQFQLELDPYPDWDQLRSLPNQVLWHLGVPAAFWKEFVCLALESPRTLQGEVRAGNRVYAFTLQPLGRARLDPADPLDRKVLSTLASRWLRAKLKGLEAKDPRVKVQGNWLYNSKGIGAGSGWRILRGVFLDLGVDPEGTLFLEVDISHRFFPTDTLEVWLQQGYPLPKRVRSAYPDGFRGTWEVERLGEERPDQVPLPGGKSLLDYHREKGRFLDREAGRVIWLRNPSRGGEELIPHLTGLLLPVLTLEEIHELGEEGLSLQVPPEERLKMIRRSAEWAVRSLGLGGPPKPEPLQVQAYRLPSPVLVAAGNQRVGKAADALVKGVFKERKAKVALLRLDGEEGWPPFLEQEILRRVGLEVNRAGPSKATPELLEDELGFRKELRKLKNAGFSALLVLTPHLSPGGRNRLKSLSLAEGFPTQLLNTPVGEMDRFRIANALLGLLAKVGAQPVALKGEYPAELAVGFDAGGRESLRFGGAACAVGKEGGVLAWSLPEAQPGERIPEEVVWDLLQETLMAFVDSMQRMPKKVLLLRDGKVPKGEFNKALEELRKRGVAYDLVSVRKTGGGRIYPTKGRLADGLFLPLEGEEFLLLTVHREGRGTPRPLKLIREEGETPIPELARQIYHLTRLHPASGFLFPRLPVPLHLADRLVKEVGRLGIRHLKVDGSGLFFV
ncbi:MAG: argonaute PAZ domain-containing protein [Thermaceae bacterium]